MKRDVAFILFQAWLVSCGGGTVSGTGADQRIWPSDITYEARGDLLFGQGDQVAGYDVATDGYYAFVPCSSGTECPTGFCVEGPDGQMVCAPDCVEGVCPPGWACKQVANLAGDIVFVCLPEVQRLCRPCRTSEDCRPSGVITDDLCVNFGDEEGSFCGRDCADTNTCPAGYVCKQVEGPDGSKAFQCLPESGVCECTADFIEHGYTTYCYIENEFGRCQGERRCAAQGLTPCSAPIPSAEGCNGFDDNCNGITDEEGAKGCVPHYLDADKDGFGLTSDARCLCDAQGPYSATKPGDCDDANANVNPNAIEKCNNVDDDCDGEADEEGATECKFYYMDKDGDGIGQTSASQCLCKPKPPYTTTISGDCDDTSPAVGPGGEERCNALDDDCDGQTDEAGATGCNNYFIDKDGDGWGIGSDFRCLCAPQSPYTATKVTDCNDTDTQVNPGATEKCNGIDDNCDTKVDPEGTQGCTTYYIDTDGDGFGATGTGKCLCAPDSTYKVTKAGDCDDKDSAVYAGAQEVCNSKDDDCDSITDEEGAQNCTTYYYDNDGDTFGVANNSKCLCGPIGKYTATKAGDCNDNNANIKPGTTEVCANGVDDNCNGQTDEGCQTVYKIGINPDDGGGTGACGCNNICEDNLNLSMGLHLRDFLEKDTANTSGGGSWQVFMTRTDNSNPSLTARVDYLNNSGVQRAISISCNAAPEGCPSTALGAETYIKSGADANANDLANKVQPQVATHFQTTNRGVKVGNYYMLVHTNMPHIFVFVGFITNQSEANKLNTDSWRKEASRGMLHGIQQHFGYGEFDP